MQPLHGESSLAQRRVAPRVLVLVKQPVLAEVVQLALRHGRFATRTAWTGGAGAAIIEHWRPQLAVADVDAGDGGVMAWLDEVATRDEHLPVIALTRRHDVQTKLDAFALGVDDILSVPLTPQELVARALAVMRRASRGHIGYAPLIRLGELEIDMLNRRVHTGTAELQLTSVELNLLYLLAANAGQLVTREVVLDSVWGLHCAPESNVVDRHVRNLREKLQDNWRRPRFIETVPGRGYRFLETLERVEDAPPEVAAVRTSRGQPRRRARL